ncbi:ankyrin repeat domain-containing protein [Candidatus Tisiphia endosymbiont of Beris chalybata]|uniref:ankyrin repeat domain-containing protein n=1 Tax=Candidatus Tisiphia endosymbiont of Beris chalybata TaxID=3066262 RepID=UPI00312CA70F
MVQAILKEDPKSTEIKNNFSETTLHIAAHPKDAEKGIEIIEAILTINPKSATIKNKDGKTPRAASYKKLYK